MKTRNLESILELRRKDPVVHRSLRSAEGVIFNGQVMDLKTYAEALELAVIGLVGGQEVLIKSLTEIHSRMPVYMELPKP